jgi:Tol biopolymer transport system component
VSGAVAPGARAWRVGGLLCAALFVAAGCGGEGGASGEGGAEGSVATRTEAAADAGRENGPFRTGSVEVDSMIDARETHFAGLRQLTFGGQNAEAYWSPDDESLIFQATPRDGSCDQEYIMTARGENLRRVSTGEGRTTCGYFVPGKDRIVYSSTHLESATCPPEPDFSQGYVWALYPSYDIFEADRDGSNVVRLTDTPGYDAEATISRDGEWIVFTSMRDGDLDIYKMRVDGSDVTRLTDAVGYDGGPFFSYDGTKIVYRAYHPESPEKIEAYRELLGRNLIRPSTLDIWVMNADGSGKRRLTDNGAANFGPYFYPDGSRVIFSSNLGDPAGREFDLYAVGVDGSGLERITWTPDFDGFPMFNSDGTQLVFASNRGNELPRETNLFIADWVN